MPDEFDDYLARNEHPENRPEMSAEHVDIVFEAVEAMVDRVLQDEDVLQIVVRRVQPEGVKLWSTMVQGTKLVAKTFADLVYAIANSMR